MGTLVTILDGYTDEPSCLGVPPFIAPVPRYISGALKDTKKDILINYLTIDEYRNFSRRLNQNSQNKLDLLQNSNMLIIIAGALVPGKYLRGAPISLRETVSIARAFDGIRILCGACARFGFKENIKNRLGTPHLDPNDFDFICKKDPDAAVFDYLTLGSWLNRCRTPDELKIWSRAGADLVLQHPDFPKALVIELEAGRGCVRYFSGGCTFCLEPAFGKPVFRVPEEVIDEVRIFHSLGIKHFRIGALSCIFSYWAKGIGETETPTPNPLMVKRLLTGIRSAAPTLKVLHLDNANPAVMAAHVPEAIKILKIITQSCTGGNVLSFGLESADPEVIEANNLNSTPEDTEEMIKLVNKYGSMRSSTGLPTVIPGLNFVYGLKGESKNTFRLNLEFLTKILTQGLLLRRINLRQVIPVSKLKLKEFNTSKLHREFIIHKKQVREQIDSPMLQRILPPFTLVKEVLTEKHQGNITFGRQLGTYPILIGIPYKLPLNEFEDVLITDYGYRSVTGISVPIYINTASGSILQALPGIGSKRTVRILRFRPFEDLNQVRTALDDPKALSAFEQYISFENL